MNRRVYSLSAREIVTKVKHIVCSITFVVSWDGGLSKFGTTPGGGSSAGVLGVTMDSSIKEL